MGARKGGVRKGFRKGVDVRLPIRRKFNLRFVFEHFLGKGANGKIKEMIYVYLVIDPETKFVGYVGTTKDPTSRMSQHRRDARHGKLEKDEWFRQVVGWGREPIMKIIAVCTSYNDAAIIERALIKRHNLNNIIHRYKGEELTETFQYSFLSQHQEYPDDDIPY